MEICLQQLGLDRLGLPAGQTEASPSSLEKRVPRPHPQPSGSGSGPARHGFPQRARLQKLNSRVWPEAIAQVPDVLFPELVQGEKEVISVGSQRVEARPVSLMTPSKAQRSASHQGRLGPPSPFACFHPATLSPHWWALQGHVPARETRKVRLPGPSPPCRGHSCDRWSAGSHPRPRGNV